MNKLLAAIEDNTNIKVVATLLGFDVYQWMDDLNVWYPYGRSNQSVETAILSIQSIKGEF